MKIDSLDVYYVALPLIYPWRTAYGEDEAIHSVLVKIVPGGHAAWGETTPLRAPTYSPETAMSAYHVVEGTLVSKRLTGVSISSSMEARTRRSRRVGRINC